MSLEPTERPSHPGVVLPRCDGYTTRHPWPADCFVQGGSRGIVLGKNPYTTAFIEAFPREPKTFLRGEGPTLADAEDAAWAKFQKVSAGDHEHEFEARGYRNGAGLCKHCNLFQSDVFDLASIGSVCAVCGVGTYWTQVGDLLYCEQHAPSRKQRLAATRAAAAAGKPVRQLEWMFLELDDDEDDELEGAGEQVPVDPQHDA